MMHFSSRFNSSLSAGRQYFGETIKGGKGKKGSINPSHDVTRGDDTSGRRQGSCGDGGGTDMSQEDKKNFMEIFWPLIAKIKARKAAAKKKK